MLVIGKQLEFTLTCESMDELCNGNSELMLSERLHVLCLMSSNPATENVAIPGGLIEISKRTALLSINEPS